MWLTHWVHRWTTCFAGILCPWDPVPMEYEPQTIEVPRSLIELAEGQELTFVKDDAARN